MEKTEKDLYSSYLCDLNVSQFKVNNAIKSIDKLMQENKIIKNGKLAMNFEVEKKEKIKERNEMENQLEEIKKNNKQKIIIDYFNTKIDQQKILLSKYSEMLEQIKDKIKRINESTPPIEMRIKEKTDKLKLLNKENVKLMEQITQMEKGSANINSNLSSLNVITNSNTIDISKSLENPIVNTIKDVDNFSPEHFQQQEKSNLNEIIEKNKSLKEQYNRIISLKQKVSEKRKESKLLSNTITEMNNECFSYKKIYTEGMNMIANELLKVHEIQLDKIVNTSNNNNGNNLYFEIVKENFNGNKIKNDESLKLPIISNNIMKKYNYSLTERANPSNLIYKVIKNIKDEKNYNNKMMNLKKNNFTWEEFESFSPYQVYTILNLNKEIIKKMETYIFPRKPALPKENLKLHGNNSEKVIK